MHSLEMLVRLNSAKHARKERRAALLFNRGSELHAKGAEKGAKKLRLWTGILRGAK